MQIYNFPFVIYSIYLLRNEKKKEMEITETTALIRLGISLLLGAGIGMEREYHNHPAGLRTFTLISLASTLAMLVSIWVCQTNTHLINGDPGRIAAQVLTGVGFIGAGLIIKHTEGISGITTAACVFITSVIGLAVGAGMILTGVIVTVAVIIILFFSNILKVKKTSDENS